jgi:hypothetical protein
MSHDKLRNPSTGREQALVTSRHSQALQSHDDTACRLAHLIPAPLVFQPKDWAFLTELPAGAERERMLAEVADYLCDRYLQWHQALYLQPVTKFLDQLFEVIPELPMRMIDSYAERPDERQRSFAPLFLIDAYRIEPTAAVRRWQAFLEGPADDTALEALEMLRYAVDDQALQPDHRRVLEGTARRLRALSV